MKNKKYNVLGVIPARGGSKGIPHKNIATLGGKPLIHWVCDSVAKSNCLERVILSSDDQMIIDAVKGKKVEVPFIRPTNLSQDNTLVVDVLVQALDWIKENEGQEYDYICLIQPTSPFTRSEDYDRAIKLAYEKKADTVVSLYPCDQRHPSIMFNLTEEGEALWYEEQTKQKKMSRRQDLPNVYMRSGSVYVFSTKMLLQDKTLYGKKTYGLEVSEERSLGIDTPRDLLWAEFMLQNGMV